MNNDTTHASVLEQEGDVAARRDAEFRRLIDRAEELRPMLCADQAETEKRGVYSAELHQIFWDEGFYKMLQPRTYGGLELRVPQFFQVIMAIARGCPSTGWALCLGAGHTLQFASYYREEAQSAIFGAHGQAFGPHSRVASGVVATRVEGGMRLSGTWRYGSGSPYSTHFIAVCSLESPVDGTMKEVWAVLPREDYTVLDDWPQGVMGMKGSGSNSVVVDDVFVPVHMFEEEEWVGTASGPTYGSALHGNTMYAGTFWGFNAGETTAVMAGAAMASVDEYERTLRTAKVPYSTQTRAENPDYQRWLGQGISYADVATAVVIQGAELFEQYARESAEGTAPFTAERGRRLQALFATAMEVGFQGVQVLLRNGSTTAVLDGQPMQRYYRDAVTATSRSSSLDGSYRNIGREYLGFSSAPTAPVGASIRDQPSAASTKAD